MLFLCSYGLTMLSLNPMGFLRRARAATIEKPVVGTGKYGAAFPLAEQVGERDSGDGIHTRRYAGDR